MRKALLFGLALAFLAGCAGTDEKKTVSDEEQAHGVIIRNLDFRFREVWLASTRGVKDYFSTHPEHRYFNKTDWDHCYPDRLEPAGEDRRIPYGVMRTWFVPVTWDEPKIGLEFSRRAWVKITPDVDVEPGAKPDFGDLNVWKCRVRVFKYGRRRLPLKGHDEGWVAVRRDIVGELAVKDYIFSELEKIIERKRKGIPEKDY